MMKGQIKYGHDILFPLQLLSQIKKYHWKMFNPEVTTKSCLYGKDNILLINKIFFMNRKE